MILDVSKFIPEPLLKYGRGWNEFKNVFQSIVNYYISKIESIRYIHEPTRTEIPLGIGELVGLYPSEYYTDREIRKKLSRSTNINKNLGNFFIVLKPELDELFDIDCSLYYGTIIYDKFYIDGSKIDSESLIEVINFAESTRSKGEVYIDLKRQLDADEINKLYSIVKEIVPIYYDIYFGFEQNSDIEDFTIDSSLIDGENLIEASISVQTFKILLTL